MVCQLFLSHRIDALLDRLIEQLDTAPSLPLATRTILVPNGQVKQWLLLEMAKRKGIAMGLKVLEIEQFYPSSPNSLEMFCLIYAELSKCTDPHLQAYLDGKKRRVLDLTEQLTSLFFTYGQFGSSLFQGPSEGWQQTLLHKLFVEGLWRLPVQREIATAEPMICFGIDFLPPVYWAFLFRAPALSIYLFSPCVDFWQDICTDRERKNLNRYWEKRGAAKQNRDQLDAYLREAPRNLANWGKLGRETLKVFDQFDLQMEEVYPPLQPESLLKQVQFDLLTFQEMQTGKIDDSIQVFLTGSSRLKEIECLRDEILRLNLPYHEVSVLAPDIEPYVPLIEFVFADAIPYRISGFDIAPQSSFRQGLVRLLHLASGRWEAEEVLTLFETPSFYRKQEWNSEKLEQFRTWISEVRIQWGRDAVHRNEVLVDRLGDKIYRDGASWEQGLDRLLDAVIYLLPMQVDPDSFEELIASLSGLKDLPLKGEKTLPSWADCLDAVAQKYLLADPNDEADQAALSAFRHLLLDLGNFNGEMVFPFAVIQHLLQRPCFGHIHSSHLHAVRFAPLAEGALLPAKALFLIGMDEDSFPRMKESSSLDLLKGQVSDRADRDRYLFLQALFSAEEFLRISYGHLSPDEGKPVGPSLVVQELLSAIEIQPILYGTPLGSVNFNGKIFCPSSTVEIAANLEGLQDRTVRWGEKDADKNSLDLTVCRIYRSSCPEPNSKSFLWPKRCPAPLPEGERVVSISDLRLLARHPWKFFLQKVHGMYLNGDLEESFALQKGQLLRATLDKPIAEVFATAGLPHGPLGDALRLEIAEKATEWQTQLAEWQLKPFCLVLWENCAEAHWEGPHYIVPSLKIHGVQLVGEIKQATGKGLICANEDKINGLLKVWPEALALACALNAPQIWMLRNGKMKSIENPEQSLQSFIAYYFQCLTAPSPLISDWADAFLRKGVHELEKKRPAFEDPIVEWVLARAQMPTAEEMFNDWGPYLRETFAELIQLYPARGKSHAAV